MTNETNQTNIIINNDEETQPLIEKNNTNNGNNDNKETNTNGGSTYSRLLTPLTVGLGSITASMFNLAGSYRSYVTLYDNGYITGQEKAIMDNSTTGEYNNPYPEKHYNILVPEILGATIGTFESFAAFYLGDVAGKAFAKSKWHLVITWEVGTLKKPMPAVALSAHIIR